MQSVNEHYLNHVVAAGSAGRVEASEDIVSGDGVKLVIRGTPIDAGLQDRLLAHKLRKPLEQCIHVAGGETLDEVIACATGLLEGSALFRALMPPGAECDPASVFAGLRLAPPVRSLMALQFKSRSDRLPHFVSVSLISVLLGQHLFTTDKATHRALAAAGLLHDIGELYINPAYLERDAELGPEQWRHIVAHPLVGARVLNDVAGAGRDVADAVLLHHERLDGFGYPHGVSGEDFGPSGQIVAVAEWLAGVLESGNSPLARAGMAPRLVPGEFNPDLLRIVSTAARACEDAEPVEGLIRMEVLPDIERVAATLQRFQRSQDWLEAQLAAAAPPLREVLEASRRRMLRLQASFSSTGMDTQDPKQLLAELDALGDVRTRVEVTTLVQELTWRLRELERETQVRAASLPADAGSVVGAWLARLHGP